MFIGCYSKCTVEAQFTEKGDVGLVSVFILNNGTEHL